MNKIEIHEWKNLRAKTQLKCNHCRKNNARFAIEMSYGKLPVNVVLCGDCAMLDQRIIIETVLKKEGAL